MATETAATEPTSVYLEVGKKRVFACAVDWPGWCRSGKNEQLALEALAEYVPRYAEVAKQAGIDFSTLAGDLLRVVEQLPGTASTDFGAPGEATASDANPLGGAEAERITALVRASWAVFDRIAAETPEQLRKGPRGGGRDRDKMIGHVLGAEASYARKLGIKHPQPAIGDTDAIAALRDEIAAVLAAPSDGTPLVPKGWLPRYAARRVAWHVLDHAWEMQDRTDPAD
ncbi:MAG TPA: hypothetical protein VGR74_16675 [Actinomycetota bacterium]|jgi:hypothetical protein|nr:hypothetical protein [Actinomycetota bacterium]